jgi:hypothetical protein
MLTSKLYGDTDARLAISVDVVGLSYDSATGVVSLADGYAIPTTTKVGQWDDAYSWGDHSTAGYLLSATAATTYAPIANGVTGGDMHDHSGGDGAQIDHGGLGGLADDDHTQYHNTARADAWLAAQKATANGLATLDAGGKIPVDQLPASVMQYKGVWNASTNTPTLADGTGDTGDIYRVSVAGSQDLGSGVLSFEVGDYAIYNGATWEKSDTTDAVASVNGLTGVVVLDTDNINEGETNQYFTDARARAAISNTIAGLDYDSETGVWSLATGYVIPTTTEESNWNTAYGWGDHAGLYDAAGTAASAVSGHESTYNHSLIATAVQQVDGDIHLGTGDRVYFGDSDQASAYFDGTYLVFASASGSPVYISTSLTCVNTKATSGDARCIYGSSTVTTGWSSGVNYGFTSTAFFDGSAGHANARGYGVHGRGYMRGSGTVNILAGVGADVYVYGAGATGTVNVAAAIYAGFMTYGGGATSPVTKACGVYVEDPRIGTTQWAILHSGTAPSKLGGVLQAAGFRSSDGTDGETEDVGPLSLTGGGSVTLHFKNGIFVGST